MSDLAQNLRTYTLGSTAIAAVVGDRMSQNHVPEAYDGPRIWYARANTQYDDCITSTAGANVVQENYDLECASRDIDELQSLVALVKARLNDYRGAMGTETEVCCFCNDQSDDYIPLSVSGDDGLFVGAVSVEVYPQ